MSGDVFYRVTSSKLKLLKNCEFNICLTSPKAPSNVVVNCTRFALYVSLKYN